MAGLSGKDGLLTGLGTREANMRENKPKRDVQSVEYGKVIFKSRAKRGRRARSASPLAKSC